MSSINITYKHTDSVFNSVAIEIDGKFVDSISTDESKKIELQNGKHNIKIFGGSISEVNLKGAEVKNNCWLDMDFEINNEDLYYVFSAPFLVTGKGKLKQLNKEEKKVVEEKEELIKGWIGEKGEKLYNQVMTGGFSLLAFVFADLYMVIRKMFVEAILYNVVIGILTAIILKTSFDENLAKVVFVIIHAIMGFAFYPLYKRNILRKIKKNEDKGLSYDEQLEIAKKRGGIKITLAVIVTITLCIILYFFSINIVIVGNSIFNIESNIDNKIVDRIDNIEDTYNAVNNTNLENEVIDTRTNGQTLGKLKYEIPNTLEASEYNDEEQKIYITKEYSEVIIQNTEAEYYDSVEEYLNNYISTIEGEIKSDIEVEKINQNYWNKVIVREENVTKYYYAIEYNNKIYEVQFLVDNEENFPTEFTIIKDSLKF